MLDPSLLREHVPTDQYGSPSVGMQIIDKPFSSWRTAASRIHESNRSNTITAAVLDPDEVPRECYGISLSPNSFNQDPIRAFNSVHKVRTCPLVCSGFVRLGLRCDLTIPWFRKCRIDDPTKPTEPRAFSPMSLILSGIADWVMVRTGFELSTILLQPRWIPNIFQSLGF